MSRLLGSDDPEPVAIVNRRGTAPFLLLGDHAGAAVPAGLATLGLGADDRGRHIALDLGTRALGEDLATRLDATFIHQRFSRLVIDCNRDPARDDAIPAASDGTRVPANEGLTVPARNGRIDAVHAPYHAAIAAEIARRRAARQETILVSLHSFTPCLSGGNPRPWAAGILHDGHRDAFARRCLAVLAAESGLPVGDNEPYRMDATDYTIPRHAFTAGLAYVEIEIRQDLLADDAGVSAWAATLARSLLAAAGERRRT